MTQLIAMSILILAMLVALVGLWRRTSKFPTNEAAKG